MTITKSVGAAAFTVFILAQPAGAQCYRPIFSQLPLRDLADQVAKNKKSIEALSSYAYCLETEIEDLKRAAPDPYEQIQEIVEQVKMRGRLDEIEQQLDDQRRALEQQREDQRQALEYISERLDALDP